jgi:hypothetical protein
MHPVRATADGATARLGSSLHVKGEISGNEDLYIDGTVEGLVQLDERKVTVGATAKLTADIIAGEVVVYDTVKGTNSCPVRSGSFVAFRLKRVCSSSASRSASSFNSFSAIQNKIMLIH